MPLPIYLGCHYFETEPNLHQRRNFNHSVYVYPEVLLPEADLRPRPPEGVHWGERRLEKKHRRPLSTAGEKKYNRRYFIMLGKQGGEKKIR
jgi:hypothetical protein